MEDYDYLERQVEGGPPSTAEPTTTRTAKEEKKKKKHHREHSDRRDRSSSPRKHRHRSRSRDERRENKGGGSDRRHHHSHSDRPRHHDDRGRENRGRGGGGGWIGEKEYVSSLNRQVENRPSEMMTAEEKAKKEADKELADMERATRTVFASNVNLRAEERDLFTFFSKAGKVADVKMIRDRTKRFRGISYVEMSSLAEVYSALQLSGQPLLGQPVMVKGSEHERNLQWELDQSRAMQAAVETLHQQQQQVMVPLPAGMGGDQGLLSMMMLPPGGGGGGGGMPSEYFNSLMVAQQQPGMAGAVAATAFAVSAAATAPPVVLAPQQDLDHLEAENNDGGLRLNAASRLALMQKLAGGSLAAGGLPSLPPSAPSAPVLTKEEMAVALEQGVLGPASPVPTPCLLLKNMFDLKEEQASGGDSWDQEIAAEVAGEVAKYGPVLHCHVDRDCLIGLVYVKMGSAEAAAAAKGGLSGRWFAGKKIAAEFQFAHAYKQKFGV